ncbi:dihydroneopterin aldolase [Pseudobdellovibrio sp. HCB154]|uniref:dihydroneopterin aldolase n=1 Tax=Pseudobdellovibrio sp. HCB154 TaxID=3386277 RepID=UPI00391720C7
MKQILRINSYEVWMSLGVTKEEQAQLQPVHFDITLHFEKSVKGSATDHLDDAINYAALVSHIKQVATARSFNLIENLCFITHQHLTDWVRKHGFAGELVTEATKMRPPVPALQGGVKFTCQSSV